MPENNHDNYYVSIKPDLMKNFEKDKAYFEKVLLPHLSRPTIEQLFKETRIEYERLLPQLPYIGGKANVLTAGLIRAAWCMPLFMRLEAEGLSLREIAKISYEKMEREAESISEETKLKVREFYFSPGMRAGEIKRARETQSGKYPGDWISEYVEGDGKTFDFGLDFTECALIKFLEPRNALKYVPIFCLGDYANYRALGIGFKRTQTLTNGASRCDFRFRKDWETSRGWPPEELEDEVSLALTN